MLCEEKSIEVNSVPVEINTHIKDEESFLTLPVTNLNYINSYISNFYMILSETTELYSKIDIASKCKYPEFIDYFRHYLFEKKNTKMKINTNKKTAILTKNDYDKSGFIMLISIETFQIFDIQYIEKKEEGESGFIESIETIETIETLTDGTNIIVVIQNGRIEYVRTIGTFDAETNYDSDMTHNKLFYDIINETNFDLPSIFKFTKANPTVRYCFNFLMELNFTPFPRNKPNTLQLLKFYKINDKTAELEKYMVSTEETIIKNITHLITNYIEYYDNNDIISLFSNLGSGILKTNEFYTWNKEGTDSNDLKSQITSYINTQNHEFKGIIIKFKDGSVYDIISEKYTAVLALRPTCSLEIKPTNERNLFNELFLYLWFKENNTDAFKQFGEAYDINGKYRDLFRQFDSKIREYGTLLFEMYKTNRIDESDPYKRAELDTKIPECFKCKTVTKTFYETYKYNKKNGDFINMTHSIYIKHKSMDSKFKMSFPIIMEKLIYTELLRDYYDSYKNKKYSVYGDVFGKITTPTL